MASDAAAREEKGMVPTWFGFEPQRLLRALCANAMFPYARFLVAGTENIPREGPAILAPNHRSFFDLFALVMLSRRLGRSLRVMTKAELCAAPILGPTLLAMGAVPVDRDGSAREAFNLARTVLDLGELLVVMPEGTIRRSVRRARFATQSGSGSLGQALRCTARARWHDWHRARLASTIQISASYEGPESATGKHSCRPQRSYDGQDP